VLPVLLIAKASAYATPSREAQITEEYALPPPSDRFWQHISEDQDKGLCKLPNAVNRWRFW
jgi:hypothetical protein